MSARTRAASAWTSQPALECSGMAAAVLAGEPTTEANLAAVFNLWAERIAEVHAVVGTPLECDRCGRTTYWCCCRR